MPHSSVDEAMPAPPLAAPAREPTRRGARRGRVPAVAAGVAFIGAFGLGMATKSSPRPQTATSLVAPVSIQAPRASVTALDREVQTPALKARKRPAPRPKTASPAAPVPAAPAPQISVTTTPHAGVTHNPTTGVTHTPTTGVVHSPGGGGSGVVHGGN